MAIQVKVTSNGLIEEQTSGGGGTLTVDGALTTGGVAVATKTTAVAAAAASSTITTPGVYTLSGSAAAITVTMPAVADAPGGMYIFRCASAHAHVLTASAGNGGGTNVFVGHPGGGINGAGWALTLPAIVGSSVVLIGDGLQYLVTAGSGSSTISSP